MGVRLATTDDADALARLRWSLKTEDDAADEEETSFLARYRASLIADDPSVIRWVADRDGAVIGTVTLRLARKELSPGGFVKDIGYLTNFFVMPGFRNCTVGRTLLQALIDWAQANPVELIIVWPSDRSRSLYARMGFSGRSDPWVLVL